MPYGSDKKSGFGAFCACLTWRALDLLLVLLIIGRVEAAPLQLAQLDHASWTARDGAPLNASKIFQDKDGTLWIGAEDSGLFTFDGKKFSAFQSRPTEPQLPSGPVTAMYMATDGALWVGYAASLIVQIRDHRVVRIYDEKDGLPGNGIEQLLGTSDGVVIARIRSRLFSLDAGRWNEINAEPSQLGEEIKGCYTDRVGTLWVVTPMSIWKRPAGQSHFIRTNENGGYGPSFAESPNGILWIHIVNPASNSKPGDKNFLHRIPEDGGPTSSRKLSLEVGALFVDADGYLWITTLFGIVRIDPEHWPNLDPSEWAKATGPYERDQKGYWFEKFDHLDGLSADEAFTIVRDSFGDIWAGTAKGLDRFRTPRVLRLIDKRVANLSVAMTNCPGTDLWLASTQMPLVSVHEEEIRQHGSKREPQFVYCDQAGTVWLSDFAGLFKYQADVVEQVPPPAGIAAIANRQVVGDAHRLFVAYTRNGLWRLQGGTWSQIKAEGFSDGTPLSLLMDTRGRVWAGYLRGFIAVLDGDSGKEFHADTPATLGMIQVFLETSFGLAVGGGNGIALLQGEHLRKLILADPLAAQGVSGLLQAPNGDLWLNAQHGIVRIPASEVMEALGSANYSMRSQRINEAGIAGPAPQISYLPSAIADSRGRFWFSTSNTVVSLDPKSFQPSLTPPILGAVTMTVDGAPLASNREVARGYHTIRINYLGAYITAPEKVTYKYQLNGVDESWQEVGDRTEAVYTGLRPGNYRFLVTASNGEGIWSRPDESVQFTVLPSFYQQRFFVLLCIAAVGALLWALFRLRLGYLARSIRAREQVRADERVRIARELHDTLLQGVQGLTLQFHVAAKGLPQESQTRQAMEKALALADRVQSEARNRVVRLREHGFTYESLRERFEALAAFLNPENRIRFQANIGVRFADINPSVLEELYYMGREAVANAFRHSRATDIAVEFRCVAKFVVVVITDNGCGFDVASRIQAPGDGHWGIRGMNERAQSIDASFEWHSTGAGTRITVTVPSHRAYARPASLI